MRWTPSTNTAGPRERMAGHHRKIQQKFASIRSNSRLDHHRRRHTRATNECRIPRIFMRKKTSPRWAASRPTPTTSSSQTVCVLSSLQQISRTGPAKPIPRKTGGILINRVSSQAVGGGGAAPRFRTNSPPYLSAFNQPGGTLSTVPVQVLDQFFSVVDRRCVLGRPFRFCQRSSTVPFLVSPDFWSNSFETAPLHRRFMPLSNSTSPEFR